MRSLLGDMQVDDKFVKEMFLERLPADVQTILASGSQDLTVSQLAEMADRMIESQQFQSPSVVQISTSSLTVNEQLMKQLSAMTDEMAYLKLQLARLTSSRSRSRRHINFGVKTRKLISQRIDAPFSSDSSGSGRTFHVCDTATRRRFLVNTGSQISAVPPTAADRLFPIRGLHLQTANCFPIPTFGSLSLTLNIGFRRSFTWIFVIADVPHGILGSDFLAEFGLLVDCHRARLLDRTTCATIPTRYPLPPLQDFAGALFGKAVFSKIDLVRAFHQIPLAPEDIPKTAVSTPFGLFEFIRMPFSLRYADQTFQRFIDHVLRGLPFVYAYIDDLLVASRNEGEHKEHLALVFDRLDKFGVVINPSKCMLCVCLRSSSSAIISTRKNEVADMLSRPSLSSLQLSHGIDLCAMAAEQQRVGCPGDESVSGLQLKDVPLTAGYVTILCDVSTPFHRSFVPASIRRAVFQTLHGLSHSGIRASQKVLAERFVWPGMNKDVKAWARLCLNCQRNKVQRHNKSPPGNFPSPDARFSHVHLDVVGPLPPSNGFTNLTCVDRYTRWAEAIPLPNVQAETIVKVFVNRRVSMFDAPFTVTTDRGAQFESALFQTLLNFLGCTRIRTTAYHPAANGMDERFHRQLKTVVRAVEDPGNWSDNFPLALGIRIALKPDLGCSASELVFDTTLRLPGEMDTITSRGADKTPDNLVHSLQQFMRSLSRLLFELQRLSLVSKKTWTTALMCSSSVTVCTSR
ncbi:hypothetical protein SprV_0200705700 [Sparganum proliferum]